MNRVLVRRSGLSLVEVLVYVSVLVVAVVVIVSALLTLGDAYSELRALQSMQRSALSSMERISREVRLADVVDTASSVFNTHPGVLVLQHTTESGVEIVQFSLQDGVMHVEENGVPAGTLTDEDVTVSNLVFRLIENGETEGVRAELTLEDTIGTTTIERTFYTFAVTRK